MSYLVIFLTGLTTGGLSCLALQGGLLASVIANQKGEEKNVTKKPQHLIQLDLLNWLPILMFLGTKLLVHTVFGFFLGLLGSTLTLSIEVRLAFQAFTALFMFATAMNLLEVHPIFRYVVIQPPRFVRKWIKNSKQSKAVFGPMILGAMTIFIPCGVTQAMEVLAVNSGNPWSGALIMFAFVLGTFPLFTILGVATTKLSGSLNKMFMNVAAVVLILMSLYSINGVLTVLNFPLSAQKIWYVMKTPIDGGILMQDGKSASEINIENGVQKVTIEIVNNGYLPNSFIVKAGIPVELTLKSNGVYTCALAFTMRQFGINEFLDPVDQKTIKFTPIKKGAYIYTCSMGMYTGIMKVI